MDQKICLTERQQQDTFFFNLNSQTGRCITHINLVGYPWTDNMLLLLMHHTPSMVSVVLDDAKNVTSASMGHIYICWQKITSLSIMGSFMCQESYQVIGEKCPNLTHLRLKNCPALLPNTFFHYFGGSKITTLIIDTWVHPDQEKEDRNKDVQMRFDLSNLHCLTYLRMNNDPFISRLPEVSSITGWQPHLSVLYLDECFSMDDNHVVDLLRSSPGLKSLTLKDSRFNDNILSAIATFQPLLQQLDISHNKNVTHRGIRDLVRKCVFLSSFVLKDCDISINEFPEATPLMHHDGKMDSLEDQALGMIRSRQ